MAVAVYIPMQFLQNLVEFVFGSFIPSQECQQPINPVGPIERNIPSDKALQREQKQRDRDERLVLLERCWNIECRVEYPIMRGLDRG